MGELFAFINKGQKPYRLGENQRTRRPVTLPDTDRCTYIVGHSGMGKSTLLTNLILADIERGDRGVIVLDPHNELAEAVALRCPPEQAHRVTYFCPSHQTKKVLGFNPFQLNSTSKQEFELKADAIMQVFAHTWNLNYGNAPTMQNTLETFIRTLLSAYPQYQTNLLHMLCLTRKDEVGDFWREAVLPFVRGNPAMGQNWYEWMEEGRRKTDIESSRQKIKHLLISDVLWPVLCQPTTSDCFNFQDMLTQKKVLLVALGGLDSEFVRLLGSFILTQLLVTVKLSQAEQSSPCQVYADEFYYFNPQSFQFIINEGRKFKLYCTIAHQNLTQIKNKKLEATVQSCNNIILFKVSPDDAQQLRKHFYTPQGYIQPHLLANLPDFHALVRYKQDRQRPQDWIKTYAEARPVNRQVAKTIWQQSVAYGRPRAEIDKIKDSILRVVPDTVTPPQTMPLAEEFPTEATDAKPPEKTSSPEKKPQQKAKPTKFKPGFTA
ncbi:MAG: DUF87 domain-containing protein [Ardenticatenaceae bacterium]|nr:DUF87 domain-containing protein [Ardenticatenaceae bacterium]